MNRFLKAEDELALNINEQSNLLFSKLKNLEVDSLGLPYHCLHYFKGSHFKRLFFSIETSAHLLYKAISLAGKPVREIVIMDYGAGVGTLYSLAKMIGCKMVLYNDHLAEWKLSAQLIGRAIGVEADRYIVGDVDECLQYLDANNISCSVIASRNVIEHVYKLDYFYSAIEKKQPQAIIYSSTTANWKNPITRLQHSQIHKFWEKKYRMMRREMIEKISPNISPQNLDQLADITRGKAGVDISDAVNTFLKTGRLPPATKHNGNTCHPETGVWAENLLPYMSYRKLIPPSYSVTFIPGFWDTHYTRSWKNLIGMTLNPIIDANRNIGLVLAPFIYVVAIPQRVRQPSGG